MWYVFFVGGGREERALKQIRRALDESASLGEELAKDVFVLYHEIPWHESGAWSVTRRILLPGYIFVSTTKPEALAARMREIPAFNRLLGSGDSFTPLSDQEVRWLQHITKDGRRILGISEAVKEGDAISIVSGPLQGLEAYVKKIDAHKRLATVELELLGRPVLIQLGLKIVRKS